MDSTAVLLLIIQCLSNLNNMIWIVLTLQFLLMFKIHFKIEFRIYSFLLFYSHNWILNVFISRSI